MELRYYRDQCLTTTSLLGRTPLVTNLLKEFFYSRHVNEESSSSRLLQPTDTQKIVLSTTITLMWVWHRPVAGMLLYSGKFSPGKIFTKANSVVLRKTSPDLFSRTRDWAKLNSTRTKWHLVRGYCLRTCGTRTVRDPSMSTTQFYQGRLTAAPRLVEVV